jgi:hypothetical protein
MTICLGANVLAYTQIHMHAGVAAEANGLGRRQHGDGAGKFEEKMFLFN